MELQKNNWLKRLSDMNGFGIHPNRTSNFYFAYAKEQCHAMAKSYRTSCSDVPLL